MTRNQILDIFGITSSGRDKVLKNDEEILDIVKNAYQLAKMFDEIYDKAEEGEDI